MAPEEQGHLVALLMLAHGMVLEVPEAPLMDDPQCHTAEDNHRMGVDLIPEAVYEALGVRHKEPLAEATIVVAQEGFPLEDVQTLRDEYSVFAPRY